MSYNRLFEKSGSLTIGDFRSIDDSIVDASLSEYCQFRMSIARVGKNGLAVGIIQKGEVNR